MRTNLLLILCLTILITQTLPAQKSEITTVIIVRHAEKESTPNENETTDMLKRGDVKLTEAGEQRAVKLAQMLNKSEVSAVFSTNTTRTIETVNNYADKSGLEITLKLPRK